jgi:hypothetical protein
MEGSMTYIFGGIASVFSGKGSLGISVGRLASILSIIMAFTFVTACATTTSKVGDQKDSARTAESAERPSEPVRLSLMGTVFEDVDVPAELQIVEGESIMINTANFLGGAIVYKGKVTVDSLIRFFKVQMPKRGWEFSGSSYAGHNIILAFTKPARNCIIHVTEPSDWGGSQRTQIWVGSGSMKPEGPVRGQ